MKRRRVVDEPVVEPKTLRQVTLEREPTTFVLYVDITARRSMAEIAKLVHNSLQGTEGVERVSVKAKTNSGRVEPANTRSDA